MIFVLRLKIALLVIIAPYLDIMKRIYQTWLFVFLSCYCYAQGLKVTGKVTDEKGEPLIGASVLEKGTGNGSQTGKRDHLKLLIFDH